LSCCLSVFTVFHLSTTNHQRKGLAAVWGLEIRQPVTKVDNCNIADVLFISQIYNVKLELKLNRITNVDV
jgi:hypothetical protein